jgi:hypothetical protein
MNATVPSNGEVSLMTCSPGTPSRSYSTEPAAQLLDGGGRRCRNSRRERCRPAGGRWLPRGRGSRRARRFGWHTRGPAMSCSYVIPLPKTLRNQRSVVPMPVGDHLMQVLVRYQMRHEADEPGGIEVWALVDDPPTHRGPCPDAHVARVDDAGSDCGCRIVAPPATRTVSGAERDMAAAATRRREMPATPSRAMTWRQASRRGGSPMRPHMARWRSSIAACPGSSWLVTRLRLTRLPGRCSGIRVGCPPCVPWHVPGRSGFVEGSCRRQAYPSPQVAHRPVRPRARTSTHVRR